MPESITPLPFSGVRILDLTSPVTAYCGRVLAGYGADVVRVEPPVAAGARPCDGHGGWLDAWYAAGCQSITLDVRDERLLPVLSELATTVDVVIASPTAHTPVAGFVEEPVGLSWCDPSVVVCLLTPFGATGPLRNWRATPLTAHAMSGLMYAVGAETGPPLAMPGRQLWDGAGVRAAACVAAALHERPGVGGQVLDISAHEILASQDDLIHRFDVAGLVMRRRTNFAVPPSGSWRVADGMVEIAANTPDHWRSFVMTVGSPAELVDDMWVERAMRIQLHDVLAEIVERLLAPRRRAELIAEGQANGLPCSALNTPEEFIDELRLDARNPLVTMDHELLGSCDVPGSPIHVDGVFHRERLVAPVCGRDTERVLVDELGHSRRELTAWRECGLV